MANEDKLPRSLKDFWLYYWRYDPVRWSLFMVQDIIHYSRYQLAFIFIGMGIDKLANRTPAEGIPAEVWWLAVIVFIILSIGEGVHVWASYILRYWKPALREYIRSDFFNYALGHSHAYFQDNFAGSLARKITEVAESSMRLHDHMRHNIFGALVSMFSAAILMFFVSPFYTAALLTFIVSVTLPVVLRLKKINQRSRYFSDKRAHVTGTVVDILSNIASMRNFSNVNYEEAMHSFDSRAERKADSKRILTMIQIENYRRLSLVFLGGGMFVALILGWQAGIVSVGEMGTVMGQTVMLVGATWMFGMGVIMTADEIGYIDDAIRMITPAHDVTDKEKAADLKITKGEIAFNHVGFSYSGERVFNDLDFVIQSNQKIGLLGPSGAGKSTLVSLLLRLFDIQEGSITIDGQDISNVTQDSLRAQISVIPQDTSLFHRSLADNIRYGCLDATDEQVIDAAQKAFAHDFITALPDGYDTMVGERGIKLSGGQRQRIAIARAILKDAPILLLDEATSALDSESEQHIQESLEQLMEGKTVIAIAHRLSTISRLDRLIVMNEGQIIEDGTHGDLLKAKGYYAKLWNMQSGGFMDYNL